jgi:multiple sugar transport system ATP-binding protein
MSEIVLQDLTKRFGDVTAVDRLNVTIKSKEFFVVVGPTACGKTTLLRLIAGLLEPDEGRILFDGQLVNRLAAGQRGVRMVFQDYALYPHMKVFDEKRFSNLSFPLKLRRMETGAIKGIVDGIAGRLRIKEILYKRKPHQLSAGQKQKVAGGRALALPPKILLMDEPLSNLDPQSRLHARDETKKLHNEWKVTTVYVTHDLAEAFALADRVAVMRNGSFIQTGTPQEIQKNPVDDFVESFVHSYKELSKGLFDS